MSLEDSLLAGRDALRFSVALHEWGRQMEHARQWFVDLSRFMMGGKWGCVRTGRESGGDGRREGQLSVQDSERQEVSGWGGPSTVVLLLFELIVFYFSTLLCVLPFCRLPRRVSLPSHWTPSHPPRTQRCLSDGLIDTCSDILQHKGNLFYSPLIWRPSSLH